MVERYGVEAVMGEGAQDIRMLNAMTGAANVYRFVKRLRGMVGKDIHRLSEGERDLLAFLHNEGWL